MGQSSVGSLMHDWQGFYTLLGGASATLVGLVFVALSVGARMISSATDEKVKTFLTPTIVYLSLVLLLALLMNVPGEGGVAVTAEFGLVGVSSGAYSLSHMERIFRFRNEGLVGPSVVAWNLVLPLAAAVGLSAAAVFLTRAPTSAFDAAAGGVLLMMLVGLRNAWNATLVLASKSPS